LTLASRICVMNKGQIQQFDTPDRVYNQPANRFVASFLGSPSMNFIEGRLSVKGSQVVFESPVLQTDVTHYAFKATPAANQECSLGIRAEHLYPATHSQTPVIQTEVDLVEPMGAHQIAWLKSGNVSLAMQTEPQMTLNPGQKFQVALQTQHISLFDKASQNRL